METTSEAIKYIKKLVNDYRKKHITESEYDELIRDDHIEERDIKGYHGREILELLQNADDAYQKSIELGNKPSEDLEVVITYKDNILSISNTGTFFDKEGIKAIVQGNNSPKEGKYIGSKGTGFRSILNWANSVKIFSGGFNIEFSNKIASDFFETIKQHPQIQKQLKRKHDLYVPMLAIPKNIEVTSSSTKTTIQIGIDDDKQNDDFSVTKQLHSIDLRSLLFLPNISKIVINTEEENITYKRDNIFVNNGEINVTLQKICSGIVEYEEKYYLFSKTIEKAVKEQKDDETYKDIIMSIAVPMDYNNFEPHYLYSFFPLLEAASPFNCVMHASYVLGDHRNTIISSEENKLVAIEQIKFLIDIAKRFIEKEYYDIAYKLLIPLNFSKSNFKFLMPFLKFELENLYLELLSDENIFQTVTGKNISINNSPKILHKGFPNFFSGSSFGNLLKPFNLEVIYDFLDVLSKFKNINMSFSQNELCEIINQESIKWSVQQQVEAFIWWNDAGFRYTLPKLLKTQDDCYLQINNECYFLLGEFDNVKIPSWVTIPSLKNEYQIELIKQTESSENFQSYKEAAKSNPCARIISQQDLYPTIKFNYRDRNSIISAVNSSVSEYEQSLEFVVWLWENYHLENDWNPPGRNKDSSTFTYNFPNKKSRTVINSEKLYFGSEYDNSLAAQIFDSSYTSFPNISDFELTNIDVKEFKDFIYKFGVKYFPEIMVQPISNMNQNYRKKYNNYNNVYGFYLPYINDLEIILKQLPTEDVIKWIISDSSLLTNLSNSYATEGHFQAQYSYKGRYYLCNEKSVSIYNYMLEIFNDTPWIQIGDGRYAPRDIIQNFRTEVKNNDKFADFIPVLSIKQIEKISKQLNTDFISIRNIFELFSFCNDVTELTSEAFYGLMLDIQDCKELSKKVDLSHAVYRAIEHKKDSPLSFDYSNNKTRFLREGKILAKYHGQLEFYKADLCYVPSTKILNKTEEHIIDKGTRTGNENFKRIFNCQEYNKENKIIPGSAVPSLANNRFQEYYKDFLKFAYAFKDLNTNISKSIYSISISLVKEIYVQQNNARIRVSNEYECLRDSANIWYIIVPGTDYSINEISERIELIFSNIANTPGFEAGKFGELFRAKTKEDREFLIKKEFGSLSVIDSDNYKNDIKNNFINALKNINDDYTVHDCEINFDSFFDIDNSAKIISFLTKYQIDIEDLKNAGFEYTINLIPYFKYILTDFITKNKRKFKNTLYLIAEHDEDSQKSFLQDYYKFEDFSFYEYKNSIYFNIIDIIKNEFSNILNNPIIKDYPTFDAEEEYSKNYDLLNPQNLYGDIIANDDLVKTMIYFGKKDAFNNWLIQIEKKEEGQNSDNQYSKYSNVIPKRQDIFYNEETEDKGNNNQPRNNHGAFTRTGAERKQKNQKIMGNKGELLIYNLLCKEYGQKNVYPKSEAFVDLGIIKSGQATSNFYDLSYIDENKDEHFVEVKTGESNSFYISPKELQFAKDNANNYKLYIVYNLDKDEPNYRILPPKFWENEKFRMKEIIESIYINF